MCKLQWLGLYTTKGITLKLHGLHFLMDECIRENNIDGNLRTTCNYQLINRQYINNALGSSRKNNKHANLSCASK